MVLGANHLITLLAKDLRQDASEIEFDCSHSISGSSTQLNSKVEVNSRFIDCFSAFFK